MIFLFSHYSDIIYIRYWDTYLKKVNQNFKLGIKTQNLSDDTEGYFKAIDKQFKEVSNAFNKALSNIGNSSKINKTSSGSSSATVSPSEKEKAEMVINKLNTTETMISKITENLRKGNFHF
jgi:hypothetical protein